MIALTVTMMLTGEVAYLSNVDGVEDNALYVTSGVSFSLDAWHGEIAGSLRKHNHFDGSSESDRLIQLSGGYAFESGLDLSIGLGDQQVEGIQYHTLGVRLTKSFEFSSDE